MQVKFISVFNLVFLIIIIIVDKYLTVNVFQNPNCKVWKTQFLYQKTKECASKVVNCQTKGKIKLLVLIYKNENLF